MSSKIFGLSLGKSTNSNHSPTLFGSLAVMIHTHCELLSYWMGKFGDVKVPEGPCRFDPQVFTAKVKRSTQTHIHRKLKDFISLITFFYINKGYVNTSASKKKK